MNQNCSRFDMKKVLMYSVLVLLIALSVYALYVIFHTPKKVSDVSFENNIKCSKYIEQETEKVLGSNKSAVPIAPTIFYSPSKQTCISAYIIVNPEMDYTGYYIEDILRNDSLYHKGARNTETQMVKEAEAGFLAQKTLLMGDYLSK